MIDQPMSRECIKIEKQVFHHAHFDRRWIMDIQCAKDSEFVKQLRMS